MRCLHPSDAGTSGSINLPPDPGDTSRYIEFPALERQEEEATMHQDKTYQQEQGHDDSTSAADAMPQGDEQPPIDHQGTNYQNDDMPHHQLTNTSQEPGGSQPSDENGGIDDDDLLEMMSSKVKATHTIAPDHQLSQGPYGSPANQC